MGTLGEEQGDVMLLLEDNVDVTLGRGGGSVLARPLDTDGTELTESLNETALSDIPGNTTQEYLARENWILLLPWRKLT